MIMNFRLQLLKVVNWLENSICHSIFIRVLVVFSILMKNEEMKYSCALIMTNLKHVIGNINTRLFIFTLYFKI